MKKNNSNSQTNSDRAGKPGKGAWSGSAIHSLRRARLFERAESLYLTVGFSDEAFADIGDR